MDRPCTKNRCQFSPAHNTQLDTRLEEKKRKTKRSWRPTIEKERKEFDFESWTEAVRSAQDRSK